MSRAFIQKRTPFKPTDIGGCQLWLDAADATTITRSGANVTRWNDKANNYSGPATNNPQYNSNPINLLPTIRFDGASNRYVLISANNYNYSFMTYFMVIRWISGTGGFMGTDRPGNYGRALAVSSPNVQLLLYSQFYTTSIPLTANQPCILSAYFNGTTNFTVILNGTPTVFAVAQGGGNTNTNGFNIGVFNPTNSGNHSFDMGEGIVYSSILNETQRQQVESYLAQKWGLRQQLPQGHPGTRGIVYPSDPVNLLVRLPYPVIFTPLQIQTGSCQLWLDGADPAGTGIVPANGTVLTSWIDKSGKSKNATGVNSPTVVTSGVNSLSVVSYNGSSYSYSSIAAGSFPSGMVIFIVYKVNGAVTYCAPITRTIGNMGYPIDQYNSVRYMGGPGGGSSWSHASATSTTLFSQIILTSGANILSEYVNGTSATVTGAFPYYDTASFIYIGTRDDKVTSFNGYMCEAIVYNAVFTTLQRQQVEGYLAWKWGLQGSLDASNPYKNAPPNTTNALGISRPAGVPIPPITISARPRPVFLYTATFTYSAAGNQTFQVPSTIRPAAVTVYMWGAGAGGNTNYGGAGAMVQGVLTVIPGETLTIVVGQGGTIDGTTTYGGGGAGAGNMAFGGDPGIGYSGNGFPQNAGSGGGRSAIQRGGTDPTNDIVVAGGGGGGTYFSSDRGGAATFSGTANPGTGGLPGLGGTQTAGGAGGGTGFYGQGLGGSRGVGGNTYNTNIFNGGGGGGGGYYGGGGGGTNGGDGAGGGGGSSLTGGLSLIPGQSVLGFNSANGFTAPNTASPYYQSGVGNGAPAINSSPRAGGNGLIVLIYYA